MKVNPGWPEGVSIVIPTLNRPELLERLLESLGPVRSEVDIPTEIIVVDDSSPAKREAVERACQKHGAQYIFKATDLSSKRNLGIQTGSYSIVLLIDDDCVAEPGLITEHVRVYREHPGGRVGGCVGLTEFYGEETWLWEVLESDTPFTIPFEFARVMDEVPWGTTNNMSATREALEAIGGFRTTLRKGQGAEDVDLCLRIREAGWVLKAAPEAKILHTRATWNRLGATLSRLMHYGRADAHLTRLHSEQALVDMPRLTLMALLALLGAAVLGVALGRAWPLAAWSLWLVLTLGLNAVFLAGWRNRRHALLRVFVGDLLCRVFEFGVVYESLIGLNWAGLTRRMVYTSGQQLGDWYQGSFRLWAALLSALLVGSCFGIWLAL